jgi:flagellar biosynthesis chaperone FliJ
MLRKTAHNSVALLSDECDLFDAQRFASRLWVSVREARQETQKMRQFVEDSRAYLRHKTERLSGSVPTKAEVIATG